MSAVDTRRGWAAAPVVLSAIALGTVPVSAQPAPARPRPRVVLPKLVHVVNAPYPPQAQKEGREGVVILVVVVRVDGTVGDVKVSRSAGADFDAAAVAAVKQFRYEPARVNGKIVAAKIRIAYPFKLRRQAPVRPPPSRVRARPRPRVPPRVRAAPPRVRRPPPRRVVPRPRPSGRKLLATLRGRVREKGVRTPLDGAAVIALLVDPKDKSERPVGTAYADAKGNFELKELVPGKYVVRVRSPGCYPYKVNETLSAGGRVEVEYWLERDRPAGFETVVRGRAVRKEVSRHTVVLEEIQKIPGTQGDALRAIQNMPGMARAPFGGGLLVVRGSAPGDSRVFIEGHQIPQLYHFFGLTSVFNSDLLKEIVFIPGNFSVRYGRATGGIIDVFTRKAKRDRWHGYVDLDLWDIGVLAEGPVGKGSLALSLRRSHIDAILAALPKKTIGLGFSLAPAYYDYQAIFDYPVGKGHLKVLAFGSDDRVKVVFSQPRSFDSGARQVNTATLFHKAIAIWGRKWGKNEAKVSFSAGYLENNSRFSETLRLKFNWGAFSWRGEYSRRFLRNLKISFGFDGELNVAHADFTLPRVPREGEIPSPLATQERVTNSGTELLFNQAFFVEATWKPLKWLTIIPGLRFDVFRFISVAATVFDPRLTTTFQLSKKVNLGLAVGLFHKEPQVFEVVSFMGGNPMVDHVRTVHTSLSLKWKILPTVTLESTAYYKHLVNNISISQRIVQRDGLVDTENVANHGRGRIYGLELSLKAKPSRKCPKFLKLKKCFGWLTYTLLRSERQDLPGGPWRLFDFDQTHILTLVLSGTWRYGWSLGIRFRLASGNPTTVLGPGFYDADADVYIPIPDRLNNYRMPLFHQLDLRVDKKWVFKRWILTLYLDIQNVYNHQAKEFLTYSFNYGQRGFVTGLPIIPSIGIKGMF